MKNTLQFKKPYGDEETRVEMKKDFHDWCLQIQSELNEVDWTLACLDNVYKEDELAKEAYEDATARLADTVQRALLEVQELLREY